MPAFPEEVDAAIDEGVDIQFLAAPVKVLTKDGKVTGVQCIRMKLGEKDASGRRKPIPDQGLEFHGEAGHAHPGHRRAAGNILYCAERQHQPGSRRTSIVDGETLKTTRAGIFAGGDAVTGPNTVVDAMAAGKAAAETIEKYLSGQPLARVSRLTRPSVYVKPVEISEGGAPKRSGRRCRI